MSARWLTIGLVGVVMLGGCLRRERQVVVYVSTDEAIALPILRRFESETGIRVLMVGDTEARKTTGLLDRLRAERGHGVADVLWSSEAIGTEALLDEGLLAPHVSPVTTAWPEAWRSPNHEWHAFSPRPRVLVFDPRRIDRDDLPDSWFDLPDPRWAGEVVFADPRFGTTGGHLAAMRWLAGPESYANWVADMRAGGVRMLPGGNAAVVDAVRRGEALLGATDADDVRAANRTGAKLAMVIPGHAPVAGGGPMVMPNTVAILQGAPHPSEAAALTDWLLSDHTARMLASSVSGNIPLQESVASEFPDLLIASPLLLDIDAVESNAQDAVAAAATAWGGAPLGGR
ncbi:MAG: extracellular solute-binding protein [Phycisphaerales bacterium]|nr:extracellular solute-binding protein [Phycisphaerales bacterium]